MNKTIFRTAFLIVVLSSQAGWGCTTDQYNACIAALVTCNTDYQKVYNKQVNNCDLCQSSCGTAQQKCNVCRSLLGQYTEAKNYEKICQYACPVPSYSEYMR